MLTQNEKRFIYEALKTWNGPHCWGFHKGYRLDLGVAMQRLDLA